MLRSLALVAALAAPALYAQAPVAAVPVEMAVAPVEVAALEPTPLPAPLPDAPSAVSSSSTVAGDVDAPEEGAFGGGQTRIGRTGDVAPKYAGIVLPGQTTVPLTAGNKVLYGFRDAFSLYGLAGATVSALWSYGIDSAPHYEGSDWDSFGKRWGVAELRTVQQNLYRSAIFAPIFHDDPRYYELGRQHKFLNRVIYAGTRVVITRTDSGRNTINAPLLLAYGATAGMNNLYYPDQDTGAKQTLESWGSSLGGAALGFEVNEFLDDALHLVHLRK